MNPIGFSTGALALGDFRRGIELQQELNVDAIELSALREDELSDLVSALPTLNLSQFKYRSFHAPSSLVNLTEAALVDQLLPVASLGLSVVVHPDIITNFEVWNRLEDALLVENMDRRKSTARTMSEMLQFFTRLPKARFCFDIGHAHQLDPSMGVATELLLRFRHQLAEVHISEVNWTCKHVPISTPAAMAFQRVAKLIPDSIPVIIESLIEARQLRAELAMARRCLDQTVSLFSRVGPTSERCATA